MKYRVVLVPSENGFAVSCPALPGCWSQGTNEEEALANIRDAVRDYVEVQAELLAREARGGHTGAGAPSRAGRRVGDAARNDSLDAG